MGELNNLERVTERKVMMTEVSLGVMNKIPDFVEERLTTWTKGRTG